MMIWYTIIPLGICASLGLLFQSLQVSIFFIWQSVVGFTLLELVNYIEHYGLERKMVGGFYEKVTPNHSWNAPFKVTNYFLFKLQRHSDHHAYPFRKYQILRSWEQSPKLPTGYAGMILLSLIPPLWFSVMDPLVDALNKEGQNEAEEKKIRKIK
eukprot:TRINITY_DN6216_c0_g1_i2.p1 TRINITY_DN6216_c0_g1~~TRINITY_DN6216_c0_g1_i2.p1  ORF type:complete len:155 (+),score=13.69 TRINITY_DN6216_c0_g1_i2:461-925(+)